VVHRTVVRLCVEMQLVTLFYPCPAEEVQQHQGHGVLTSIPQAILPLSVGRDRRWPSERLPWQRRTRLACSGIADGRRVQQFSKNMGGRMAEIWWVGRRRTLSQRLRSLDNSASKIAAVFLQFAYCETWRRSAMLMWDPDANRRACPANARPLPQGYDACEQFPSIASSCMHGGSYHQARALDAPKNFCIALSRPLPSHRPIIDRVCQTRRTPT
jgi:hypothetical protein